MAKLIIVCGLPGSGKTTFAKELSKRLKIACIHKDSIKEVLYGGLNCSTLEDSKSIGKPSVYVMLHLAEEQLQNGIDVIIEAPFTFPEDYFLFNEWNKKYNVDLYGIICSIDKEERERRFTNRERHAGHHDRQRFFDYRENFDYRTIPGKQIRIETNKPVEILVNKVIEIIK